MTRWNPLVSIIRGTALVLVLAVAAPCAFADPIVIQGSTTFARRLLEPFQTDIEQATGHQLTVVPNKSIPGLIALMEGRAHLTMISTPLEAEIALLQKSTPGMGFENLREHQISRTRVAVIVHGSNQVRKATLAQLRDILLGKIENWKALGGPDLPIRVILVGGGGGVTATVEAALLNGDSTTAPNKIYTKTPVQLVQVVEQEKGALGFAQLALQKQRNIPELVTDKPLEQALSFVTFGEPTPAALSVIKATRAIATKAM